MTEEGSRLFQYFSAAAANLIIVASGAVVAWTSPTLAKLKQSDPIASDNPLGVAITEAESSWIGSIIALGAIFGSVFAGYLSERFGRKRGLLFSAIPYLIGWALIATSSNLIQLYLARFIFGIGLSIAFTIVPMYCGEIAETAIRGILGSFLQLFITVGMLYSYCIGPYVSYTVLWILCSLLPILFVACFIFMPESPYYLLKIGNKVDASQALARLRGKSEVSVQGELDAMKASIDEAFAEKTKFTDLYTSKANFKALQITCAAVSFQQFTGISVVIFYTESIFKSTGTSLDPAICAIIIGLIQFGASAMTPFLIDRLGRRSLLMISGTGTAVSTCALGIFFYLKSSTAYHNIDSISWLPTSSLILFMCTYCIGWGPLPWTIMGEMFASSVKAKASGITVFVCWCLAFLITKYFSTVESILGTYACFWIFTGSCIVSVAFAIVLLPETKGKSLIEIQNELNGLKAASSR